MNPSDPLPAAPIDIPQALSRTVRVGAAMAVAAALSGCASFSPDGGMSVAAGIAAQEIKKYAVAIRAPEDATSARARVEHLLKQPLTAAAAVQIALLNNRGLQAAYNELGVAEAMMVQASLPPNPGFSFSRISGSLESELEGTIAANILALATLPPSRHNGRSPLLFVIGPSAPASVMAPTLAFRLSDVLASAGDRDL
jgi:hypothetical protein